MKFTLSWLKDHLETEASLDEIVRTLTAVGLEVESVDDPAARLAPFTIAEVVSAEAHPDADKLRVLRVETGSGEPLQVVCGAPNARAGMKGVFAAEGSYVPGTGITLKPTKIRGVASNGMMVSERELELSEDHDGIIDLPDDAPVGTSYASWAGLDDPVIEIGITPNRQDCLGVHGIARDLAAAGLGTLKEGTVELVPAAFPSPVEIRTEDEEGCPALYGRVVRGVKNGSSPAWMQRRLRAVGLRPIDALVDITNYLMLDRARPLHVYDLAKLDGPLVARKAKAGETVEALNEKTYELAPSMTVLADDAGAHDIGGIMGGERTGVSADTTDVLIECAYFDPVSVARTGQALSLYSDARARFERGVDPGFLEGGIELATRLVLDLCGGEASDIARAGTPPTEKKIVSYDPALCASLSGVDVDEAEQARILSELGFDVDRAFPWSVTVPLWRRDVDGAADIVEEVIRIHGLHTVPSTPLPRGEGVAAPTATPAQTMERRVRRALAARGLDEMITWSFVSDAEAEAFGGTSFRLANPISADLVAMKRSALPSLVSAARTNLDRGARTVRVFELARRYLDDGERPTVGILLAGLSREKDWRTGNEAGFDIFDAKAEALAALAAAGAPTDNLQVQAGASDWYHPGRSGRLMLGPKTCLAEFGELHPRTARAMDVGGRVAAAEVFLDAVPAAKGKRARPAFAPPALQPVLRDFAFLLDQAVPTADLVRAVAGADKSAITEVRLFDYFEGAGVPEGKVSVAIRVTLQPGDKSFTDEELSAISAKVVAAAEKRGATLR
ncbi:phenylalanine--tRNA ligase subunit beta [Pacificimonas flava]|uniref:Phenylalanine--tRNA ligase beta subunit n=2 Tax=Pacificimonas TaxID=1960290 RepID=A0A219B5D9_9SPHN|nr:MULTISPECIES: phenylalanine--tRNA ligase subunit beta [Pacificimonas]MBZ6377280.1 phenylalanine--tRNA ligase subunit beta [Pacificimonas aurantium]OWV33009.1 phenylalanine--tRNA ligase subunit beta [Pacificimonas flava]